MGHLFTPNAERGVFKTTDGGKTWKKVLYVNDRIGAVDLAMVESDAGHALRGHVRQGPPALALRARRPGERDLQDDRRRQDLDASRRRAADRPHRPDRARRLSRRTPTILYAVVENGNRRPPTTAEAEQDKRRGGRAGAADRRQRGLSHGRRRPDLAQGQRRLRGGPRTRRLTPSTSSASTRTIRRPSTSPVSRWPRRTTAARPGRGSTGRPTGSCRGPSATGGRCGSTRSTRTASSSARDGGVNISYDRGRTSHPRLQHAADASSTPSAWTWRTRTTSTAACRTTTRGKGPSNGWAGRDLARRLGDGRRRRRHVQLRRSDRLALGLQQPRDGDDVAVRPEDGRPDADHAAARRPGSAAPALQLDAAGRPLAPQLRPSSTPGPRSSSGPSTAATTGRRSAPT